MHYLWYTPKKLSFRNEEVEGGCKLLLTVKMRHLFVLGQHAEVLPQSDLISKLLGPTISGLEVDVLECIVLDTPQKNCLLETPHNMSLSVEFFLHKRSFVAPLNAASWHRMIDKSLLAFRRRVEARVEGLIEPCLETGFIASYGQKVI
jgi:hypothetical protein